ncbi:MAG: hypothetical protein EBS31_00255 [Burkholderiaceae bacterium]|nr:hypothetical protein [Burkholderiaceae bacterium]
MQVLKDQSEWTLTALDRCDAGCTAQAYVKAIGVSGELLFCSHHYNKIVSTELGLERLENFAYQIVDERDRLIENRLVGEN